MRLQSSTQLISFMGTVKNKPHWLYFILGQDPIRNNFEEFLAKLPQFWREA